MENSADKYRLGEDCEVIQDECCSELEFRVSVLAKTQDGVCSVELGITLQVTDLHWAMTVLVPDVGYTVFSPEPLDRAH